MNIKSSMRSINSEKKKRNKKNTQRREIEEKTSMQLPKREILVMSRVIQAKIFLSISLLYEEKKKKEIKWLQYK